MTGNTLTQNPITGTNAYANGAYGTTQPGFWGNSFGGSTPTGFGTQTFQNQVPMNTLNPFTTPLIQQQPSFLGQTTPWQTGFNTPQVTSPWQTGFNTQQLTSPWQTGLNTQQVTSQAILNAALQTTPPQVINTILQTTPPQVLGYILNALACQQVCQQVLQQNPQTIQAINQQTTTQPYLGYNTTNQGQYGFGGTIGGQGFTQVPFVGGYQGQTVPQQFLQGQGNCVGCTPGMQQLMPNTVGFQGSFGQVLPQQPWFNTTYGTW
jgi:hypothetical protein